MCITSMLLGGQNSRKFIARGSVAVQSRFELRSLADRVPGEFSLGFALAFEHVGAPEHLRSAAKMTPFLRALSRIEDFPFGQPVHAC